MARPNGQHSIDIPAYLWEALDHAAAFHNIPTNRMIAHWLWECARRHADQPDLAPELAGELADLPRPYDRDMGGTRDYPRRSPDDPRRPRSALAAQIVAEGSPSPTLAALQRRSHESLAAERDKQ